MYAALTHTLDCVCDPTTSCIDVYCAVEPRALSLEERAKLACERAEHLAAQEEVCPPWHFLSERMSILSAECEHRVVAMAKWSDEEFRSAPPPTHLFEQTLPALLPVGRAALRDSPALSALRARLVPAICNELAFWNVFFEHVRAVRTSLLPPRPVMRSASEERREDLDEFERFLASPLELESPSVET